MSSPQFAVGGGQQRSKHHPVTLQPVHAPPRGGPARRAAPPHGGAGVGGPAFGLGGQGTAAGLGHAGSGAAGPADLLVVQLDQALVGQPIQHPIQGAHLEPDLSVGELGGLAHDAVAWRGRSARR